MTASTRGHSVTSSLRMSPTSRPIWNVNARGPWKASRTANARRACDAPSKPTQGSANVSSRGRGSAMPSTCLHMPALGKWCNSFVMLAVSHAGHFPLCAMAPPPVRTQGQTCLPVRTQGRTQRRVCTTSTRPRARHACAGGCFRPVRPTYLLTYALGVSTGWPGLGWTRQSAVCPHGRRVTCWHVWPEGGSLLSGRLGQASCCGRLRQACTWHR